MPSLHTTQSSPSILIHQPPPENKPGFFGRLQLAFTGSSDSVNENLGPPIATLLVTLVEARNLALDNNPDKLEIVSRGNSKVVRLLSAQSERHYQLHPYVVVSLNSRYSVPLHLTRT